MFRTGSISHPLLNKTTYELFKGRKPNISYFHQFGCTCYILNNKVYLKKFDEKAQKGIFLGYSERSKAYRLYNLETLCVEESMHVKFDDKEPESKIPEQNESIAGSEESDDYSEPDDYSILVLTSFLFFCFHLGTTRFYFYFYNRSLGFN